MSDLPQPLPSCFCKSPEALHWTTQDASRHWIPNAFGPAYLSESTHFRIQNDFEDPLLIEEDNGWSFISPSEPPSLDVVHGFCNKACPIYFTAEFPPDLKGLRAHRKLLRQCYAAWFHHGESFCGRGTFLVKKVDVSNMFKNVQIGGNDGDGDDSYAGETGQQLKDLADLHRRICQVVETRKNNASLDDTSQKEYRDPGEELTRTNDHYWSRFEFELLPSFRRFFLVVDSVDIDERGMTLVKLGVEDAGDADWVHEKDAALSWWRGPVGQVLERLLEETGLPPSAHYEIMHTGRVNI